MTQTLDDSAALLQLLSAPGAAVFLDFDGTLVDLAPTPDGVRLETGVVDALMLRRLPPYLINIGKRLVKAPKVYVRDSGILHALLNLRSLDDLGGHPVAGLSWEGFVIEQILATLPPLTTAGFYRTSAGAELDLVVEQAGRRIGFEVKLSTAPTVSRGFWNACEDLGVSRAYVVAPVLEPYPLADNVEVISPLMLGQLGSG